MPVPLILKRGFMGIGIFREEMGRNGFMAFKSLSHKTFMCIVLLILRFIFCVHS